LHHYVAGTYPAASAAATRAKAISIRGANTSTKKTVSFADTAIFHATAAGAPLRICIPVYAITETAAPTTAVTTSL
jgi:hypothetical protein